MIPRAGFLAQALQGSWPPAFPRCCVPTQIAGSPALSRPCSACLLSRVVATSCSLCWGEVVSASLESFHYFVSRTFQLVRPLPEPGRKPLLSGIRAHGLLATWAERDGEFYLCPRALIIVHCEPHAGWQSHRARFRSPKCCLTSWVVWGQGLHLSGPQFSRLSDGDTKSACPRCKGTTIPQHPRTKAGQR